MEEYLHVAKDVLSNSILITGLVLIMMLMIEYFNVCSQGKWLSKLEGSKFKQILVSSCLGLIPGCIGGFAAVSFYTHRLLSFGALVAMMITSSGDEAFIILAMIPNKAPLLFVLLFAIAITVGVLIDYVFDKKGVKVKSCPNEIEYHASNSNCDTPSIFRASSYRPMKRPSIKRLTIMMAITLFIAAVIGGIFTCSHGHEHHGCHFSLLDEQWINIVFAIVSIITLFFTATANEHFIKEHIWHHIIKHHALSIFLWTFGTLLVCQIGLQYLDISKYISDNLFIILIIAVLIGIIPESGPHIIFITLFAQGIIPFYILLVNSIVQDGHTTIPLLAHNKIDFLKAKLVNLAVGLAVGSCCYFLM